MHPDFWLVLLRFARPGLLAVFGTVPMALGIQLFVAFGSPMTVGDDETPAAFMTRVRDEIVRLHDEHAPRILPAPSRPEGEIE